MRFGLNVMNSWPPEFTIKLAAEAEGQGWDGLFIWDHISLNDDTPLHDPWVLLGAVASSTKRLTLGTLVTPLARRRPQVVARQAVTLDHLSGGRVVLGVGLGENRWEFEAFGEEPSARVRGEKMDQALEVIRGLWRGGTPGVPRAAQRCPAPDLPPKAPEGGHPDMGGGHTAAALRRAVKHEGWAPTAQALRSWPRGWRA